MSTRYSLIPLRPRSRWFYLLAFFCVFFALSLGAWIYDEIAYGGQPMSHPVAFAIWALLFAWLAVGAWVKRG